MKLFLGRIYKAIPVCIIIAGFLLRFYPALTLRFREDELFTFDLSNRQSFVQQIIWPIDDRPPLYYLLTNLLMRLGTSELYLRLPGLLASSFSLIVIYLFFVRKDRTMALITTFLMSLSIFLINLSWQFRDYGYLILLTTFTSIVLYNLLNEILESRLPTLRTFIQFGLIASIGCMTNYLYLPFITSIYMIIGIMTYISKSKYSKRTLLNLTISIAPAYILSSMYLLRQTSIFIKTTEWIPWPNITSYYALIAATYGFTTYYWEFLARDLFMEQQFFYILLPIIGSIMLLFFSLRREKNTLYTYSLVCFFVFITYIILIHIISTALHTSLFLPRTFTPAVIMAIISIGSLLTITLKTVILREHRTLVSLICTLMYACVFLNNYTDFFEIGTFWKPNPDKTVNELLLFLDKNVAVGDQIIFFPIHYNSLYLPYFRRQKQFQSYLQLLEYIQNISTPSTNLKKVPQLPYESRIFFISNPLIFDPETEHYSEIYKKHNSDIYSSLKKFCSTDPKEQFSNSAFSIQVCQYQLPL